VHPSRKLLRAGDKFAFRAVVADAEGCPTGTRPTWSIVPGPLAAKASVDAAGTVTVAADAPEGKLEVSAGVGGKGVVVQQPRSVARCKSPRTPEVAMPCPVALTLSLWPSVN